MDETRAILIQTAREKRTIFHSDLAARLGLWQRDRRIGSWLDEIYRQEMEGERPDLTLVVVLKKTGFGPFFSRGLPTRSVRMNPNDETAKAEYRAELDRIYTAWEQN